MNKVDYPWHYIAEEGNPKKQGKYWVVFRQEGSTKLRYTADNFICYGNNCYWYTHKIFKNHIEVIAYKEIEPFVIPNKTIGDPK